MNIADLKPMFVAALDPDGKWHPFGSGLSKGYYPPVYSSLFGTPPPAHLTPFKTTQPVGSTSAAPSTPPVAASVTPSRAGTAPSGTPSSTASPKAAPARSLQVIPPPPPPKSPTSRRRHSHRGGGLHLHLPRRHPPLFAPLGRRRMDATGGGGCRAPPPPRQRSPPHPPPPPIKTNKQTRRQRPSSSGGNLRSRRARGSTATVATACAWETSRFGGKMSGRRLGLGSGTQGGSCRLCLRSRLTGVRF
jgi:hypothetical protein